VAVLEALLWAFHNGKSVLPVLRDNRRAAGCARSTVAEALRALEDAGILSWVQRINRVRIERRELHMAWAIDPTIPGATTVLTEADERRVVAWLCNRFSLDLDAVQPHGRPFTPWARDLIVRGAVLGVRGVFDEGKVRRRIGTARSSDAKFWAEIDADDADPV
jgi:hypothetical protein